jgi:hypothetical protein
MHKREVALKNTRNSSALFPDRRCFLGTAGSLAAWAALGTRAVDALAADMYTLPIAKLERTVRRAR